VNSVRAWCRRPMLALAWCQCGPWALCLDTIHWCSKTSFLQVTHGSNLNSVFVILSELNFFFLLMRVLTQNFNIVDLVKFLEKNQILHTHIVAVTLKVTLCKTMREKKKKKKEVKNQDSMGKRNFFPSTMHFSP
jgi:hypothetical protein